MPSYHARGITLRLGIAPLSDTITHKLVLKKGEVAKQQCEAAEEKLRGSKLLGEERVSFPGDEDGFDLNWLGSAPFMQVQVGTGLFGTQAPLSAYAVTDASRARVQDAAVPQALVLHVNLSSRSFVSGLDAGNQLQLKIEVLFNGQLSSCRFVPYHDIRSGAKSFHQIFSGHRIDYLAERPYVLIPPGLTTENGSTFVQNTASAEERWDQISLALQKEADARGTDKNGNAPPSAEFLHAVSIMQIPDQTRNMQKPGGRKFGIIDVIVTAGFGRKVTSGTNYLKAPQRLGDDNFTVGLDRDGIAAEVVANGSGPSNEKKVKGTIHTVDEKVKTAPHYAPVPGQPGLVSLSGVVPTLDFTHPFTGKLIPSIPPPSQGVPSRLLSPAASLVNSSNLSPQKRNIGHSRSSYPKRGLTIVDRSAQDVSTRRYWDSKDELNNTLQDKHCVMSHSPHNFPLSDPGLTQDPLDGPIDLNPYNIAASISSPVQQGTVSQKTARLQQPIYDSTRPLEPLRAPIPYVTPTAAMCGPDQTYRGLCGSVNAHTVVPFIPPNQILHSYCPEVFASSLSRHSLPRESYGPYYLPVYPYALPPNHLYSGSLPPAGLYSVPEKPRSSAPPSKSSQTSLPLDLRPTHATVSQPSILISRLVILGKHGVTLIDHWWPIPQRIGTQQTASVVYDSVDELLVGYREFLRSGAHSQRLRRRSRSPEKMGTLLTRSSIKNAISSSVCLSPDKRKRDSTHNGQMIPAHLSAGVETEPLALVEKHESETEGVQSRVQGESMRCLVSNRSTLYPRRTSLRNSILGVQGPKAATYAFEDPEEVLRQAKRLRRSRSPKKLCPVTSHSHCPIATPLADNLLNVSKKTTSSPLSSVPSTPEPEPENVIQDNIQRRSSLRRLTNPFAQVDGSPERRNPTRSPPKTRTPAVTSPRKLNNPSASESIATPARQLQSQFPDTPQSSPLFDARKRKFTKEPPSSDRFKTADNPPLNRDCVIAFAESEDKENASCILRQIKGERQGLFHEEYVVLASRFFVAVE